LTLDADIDAK
jgi:hypothetical protein